MPEELTLHNQQFGIEIELTGVSFETAERVVNSVINGVNHPTNPVVDSMRRCWYIKRDGSIRTERGGDKVEFVSPILKYEDIPTLQKIVRKLKDAGAVVNESCGIHIHVSTKKHNIVTMKNFMKLFTNNEDIFYDALNVDARRESRYCTKMKKKHRRLIDNIDLYNNDNVRHFFSNYMYDSQDHPKYSGLNLLRLISNGFERGTAEFRLFNSSLHAGEIRAYITLALAMSAYAANTVRIEKNFITAGKDAMHNFLNMIGITKENDLTVNVYRHLMKKYKSKNTEQAS